MLKIVLLLFGHQKEVISNKLQSIKYKWQEKITHTSLCYMEEYLNVFCLSRSFFLEVKSVADEGHKFVAVREPRRAQNFPSRRKNLLDKKKFEVA